MGFTDDDMAAIRLSLQVAAWALLGSLPLAVVLAHYLARGRGPLRAAVDVLVHLPLVLPPVVTGLVLLWLFSRTGPLGRALEQLFGWEVAFRWTGAAIASAVMALPVVVRAIRLAIEAVDPRLEAAATTLGAGRIVVFATVTLPLALPGVLAGALLGFAKGLGEFGATITFVANIPGETQTMPLAIFAALQAPGGEVQAWRLALVSVAIAVFSVGLSEVVARRVARRIGGT